MLITLFFSCFIRQDLLFYYFWTSFPPCWEYIHWDTRWLTWCSHWISNSSHHVTLWYYYYFSSHCTLSRPHTVQVSTHPFLQPLHVGKQRQKCQLAKSGRERWDSHAVDFPPSCLHCSLLVYRQKTAPCGFTLNPSVTNGGRNDKERHLQTPSVGFTGRLAVTLKRGRVGWRHGDTKRMQEGAGKTFKNKYSPETKAEK